MWVKNKQSVIFYIIQYVMISLHSAFSLCKEYKRVSTSSVSWKEAYHDVTSAELRTGASKYTKLL